VVTHLASQNAITDPAEEDISIQFLFRKSGILEPTITSKKAEHKFTPIIFGISRKLRQRKSSSQWTDRLAYYASEDNATEVTLTNSDTEQKNIPKKSCKDEPVDLRFEGLYFTPADPARHKTVVCIIAGTEVSWAMAIAGAFEEIERQSATIPTKESITTPRCSIGIENEALSHHERQLCYLIWKGQGLDKMHRDMECKRKYLYRPPMVEE